MQQSGRTSSCACTPNGTRTAAARRNSAKPKSLRAAEKLVTNLLPVIDDFERTIDYATKNGEAGLLGGVEAVHAKLLGVLQRTAYRSSTPAGQAFDALEAQAVATVDDASVPDETVAEVYRKVPLGTKVLRPAMVTVTREAPSAKSPRIRSERGRARRVRTTAFGRSGGPGPARAALTAPWRTKDSLGKRGHELRGRIP